MAGKERLGGWFVATWPRVGLVCDPVIVVVLVVLWNGPTAPTVLAASLLPIYRLHQHEEHGRGTFVAWFDATVGGGVPVLTLVSAFWINVLVVWVLSLAALLFLPWGGVVVIVVSSGLADPLLAHVVGVLVAVAAHAAIVGFVPRRKRALAVFTAR